MQCLSMCTQIPKNRLYVLCYRWPFMSLRKDIVEKVRNHFCLQMTLTILKHDFQSGLKFLLGMPATITSMLAMGIAVGEIGSRSFRRCGNFYVNYRRRTISNCSLWLSVWEFKVVTSNRYCKEAMELSVELQQVCHCWILNLQAYHLTFLRTSTQCLHMRFGTTSYQVSAKGQV
jgi:hypothetical protein